MRKFRETDFGQVFNLQDDRSRGRTCILLDTLFGYFCQYLAAGTLYTAFLTVNDFSLKDVSILGFLPTLISSVVVLVAPAIWERIPRRRWLLALGKLLYYIFFVLAITVIPFWVKGQSQRVFWFGAVTLLANACNAFAGNAYSAWHINFLPEEIRAKYFTYMTAVVNIVGGILLITSGLIADAIKGTPQEQTVLVILRMVGFFFGLLDVLMLVLPKEYPYPRSGAKPNLINVIRLPLKCKPFMMVMLFLSLWAYATALTSTGLTYYLMNSVGVKVTLINSLSFSYGFILILLSPLWRKALNKVGWIGFFALGVFIYAPSFFIIALLTPKNWMWLYPVMMIVQYVGNVPITLASSQLTYINMPSRDRTYYFAFSSLRVNLFNFLGQITATFVISALGDGCFSLFGWELSAIPLLGVATCVLLLIFAVLFFRFREKLTAKPGDLE